MAKRLKWQILVVLILLVSLTESGAQGITIHGTVYENSQAKTTFTPPGGFVKIYLPDDLTRGDIITGTVIAEPEGKNEREKKRNLEKLTSYSVLIPGGIRVQIQPDETGETLIGVFSEISIPETDNFRLSLITEDDKQVSFTEIEVFPTLPALTAALPGYRLSKKVISNTEPLVVLQNGNTQATSVLLTKYQSPLWPENFDDAVKLGPSSASPRKAVFPVPENLSGMYNVFVESPDGSLERIDLVSIAGIQAGIGKANLQRNESTILEVEVSGLANTAFEPVEFSLINQTPHIVDFPEGNERLVEIGNKDALTPNGNADVFRFQQEVVGIVPGNFRINASVVSPPSAYENGIQPFLEMTKSPDLFDAAIDALKKDIETAVHNSDDPAVADYLTAVESNLQASDNFQSLEEAKAFTINLFHPLAFWPSRELFLGNLAHLHEILPATAQKFNVVQPVHPLHNFAGFYSESQNMLFFEPDSRDDLLDYLGASKTAGDQYNIQILTGEEIKNFNDVFLAEINLRKPQAGGRPNGNRAEQTPYGKSEKMNKDSDKRIGLKDIGAEAKGSTGKEDKNDSAIGKAAAGALKGGQKKSDTGGVGTFVKEGASQAGKKIAADAKENDTKEPDKQGEDKADLINTGKPGLLKGTTFEDEEGRLYIFYKNAECHLARKGVDTGCGEQRISENDKLGPPTGKYERYVWTDWNECRTGKGFCTEMQQVRGIQYIYGDENCERLIDIITHEDFSCPLK